MKITETMLLEGYDGVCRDGVTAISKVGEQEIRWSYRHEHNEGENATEDRNEADYISLEYDRTGRIELDDTYPVEKAKEHTRNCNEIWGNERG